jgi:transglutaminase-like putative cysteine protease
VSTGAQVAVLDARGVRESRPRSELRPTERPVVRLVAFGGLALYAALRWGTLLSPAPVWRLLALVAVAVLIAGPCRVLHERRGSFALAAAAIALIAIFPLSGIPLSWVRHVRITVTANAIDQGLSAIPQALVPYTGINQWLRMVILLGAAILLLDAALMVCFAPRPLSEIRRAAAALPLVVLAIVPSTLARPSYAYVHGLILFALLAAFVWGDRIPRHAAPLAIGIATLAGAAAMIAAPALDEHSPWFDVHSIAGGLAPTHVDSFDWSQSYGPLNWPRAGRQVLEVKAQRADYWKTENLDLFNGRGWTQGSTDYGVQPPPPDPAQVTKYEQTIQVTLGAMRTSQVIGAGVSFPPQNLSQPYVTGVGPGTWAVISELEPGDSYRITTYSPHPTDAELAAAGSDYSALALQGYLTIELSPVGLPDDRVLFAPFGSHKPPQNTAGVPGIGGLAALRASPYARAYRLARRLEKHAATPYAFVKRVMNYLSHGYVYNENPPPSAYPLETFLFRDKFGYCQQFAGAMALLVRMGGVPARVSTGFTSGIYDRARGVYVVSDLDAHAWVEVWFPTYGWVRFDPTPASAPARGGVPPPILKAGGSAAPPTAGPVRKPEQIPATGSTTVLKHGGGTSVVPIIVVLAVLLASLALAIRACVRFREPDSEQLLEELERALSRCGRPLRDGVTLAVLEHRFRDTPLAAQYVRAIRMLRFAGSRELPTTAQRRALRTELRFGLGAFSRLRVLWALPPRWNAPWSKPARGLHSN